MNPNKFTESSISAINLGIDISKNNLQQSLKAECLALAMLEQTDGLIPRIIEKWLIFGNVNQEALIISQFTLYGNCIKGRRPAFIDAAKPDVANNLYLKFVEEFKSFGIKQRQDNLVPIWKLSF